MFSPRSLKQFLKRIQLKCQIIRYSNNLRIIVGASSTKQRYWVSTNYLLLNIADSKTFSKFFGETSVHAFLAEHVWEHLSKQYCKSACKNCFNFLQRGGYIRVAVPYGFKERLLEWIDEKGQFHFSDWKSEDDFIERSTRYDERNKIHATAYTSLIIDATKP